MINCYEHNPIKINIFQFFFANCQFIVNEALKNYNNALEIVEKIGNLEGKEIYWEFLDIIIKKLTTEDQKKYKSLYDPIPDDLYTEIINNRCYDELVEFASKKSSRLAFQVLGVLLTEHRAKMTEELRELILSNSKWEDEKYQLVNENDNTERKKYLFEFQEIIKDYREGVITEVTVIKKIDLMDENLKTLDGSLIDRPSIDYSIRKK